MNIQIKDTVTMTHINGYEDREVSYSVVYINDDTLKLSTTLDDFEYLPFTITITKQSLEKLIIHNRARHNSF